MSDQGLSIFDEPEEHPDWDDQPTQVMEAQDDPAVSKKAASKAGAAE